MSVINRMLKDLDRQGAAVFVPEGVRPVPDRPMSSGQGRRAAAWVLLLGAAVAGAAWLVWPTPKPVRTMTVVRPAPIAQASLPVLPPSSQEDVAAVTPAPTPAVVIVPTTPPAVAASPVVLVPRKAEPTLAAPRSALTGRMETHLPEFGAAKVTKEVRAMTPAEQAEDLFRQATRLVEQGRNREAQARLDEALRLNAGHAGARQTLIVLLMEAGEGARAEGLLKEGQTMQPTDAWYPRTLGQLHLQRGDNVQALAVLKAGLGKGVDAGYWGFYAALLNKLGRADEAAQAYREAARLNPEHGPWWVGLAVALEQSGQKAEAAEAYRRAMQSRLSSEVREFAAQKAQELR